MRNLHPASAERRPAPAIVMNVYYTGLGIARSLGERGIPVIGLTATRGHYGNFTRYAKSVRCPDSRSEPEALAAFLTGMGKQLECRGVIFPTRDDDVVFLDRFRAKLSPYYSIVAPESAPLGACLNKWETYTAALKAGVSVPKCWKIENQDALRHVSRDLTYPCILKAISAHHWRRGNNWKLVGARKAIVIHSEEELFREYQGIARADSRVLIQEMIPGGDDCLVIAACYMDRHSRWAAGFNTQKLIQIPAGVGTGCIVQSVNRPELFESTGRLLRAIGFTGIAEVEYKWDAAADDYKLIEINPRPWDQHRLGQACGIDLIYMAYCEHSGQPIPRAGRVTLGHKWIAEDTFVTTVLRMSWRRDTNVRRLFREARGRRIYAIWSARDPLPFLVYLFTGLFADLVLGGARKLLAALKRSFSRKAHTPSEGFFYESRLEK